MAEKQWVTTVRIPRHLGDEIELIARAEGVAVAEIIRNALAAEVACKRKDKMFQKRLQERLAADAAILTRLGVGSENRGTDEFHETQESPR